MKEPTIDDLMTLSEQLMIVPERPPYESMARWQQTFTLVWAFESEINNGGFDQFFYNSTGDYSVATRDALREIGVDDASDLLEDLDERYYAAGIGCEDMLKRLVPPHLG